MNKRFKFSIAVVISIICIPVFVSIIYIKALFPSPISKHDMKNDFLKNKDMLQSVAEYLENQEYTKIYITSTHKKGEMYASNNSKEVAKPIHIADDSTSKNIADLFEKHKYTVITKELNGIYFQRWSNRDYGRGIVYTIDGERLKNKSITKIEPLTEENWYFYEEK